MGIFDPPNMLILDMGDLQMNLGGIWSKTSFLQVLAFFTPQMGIFYPQNLQMSWETPK